jgi:hypothetical protein
VTDNRFIIGLVGEDEAHYTLMTRLADETILERARDTSGWPEREQLEQARLFGGPTPHDPARFYKRGSQFEKHLESVAGRPIKRILRVGDKPAGEASYFIELYRFFALHNPCVQALLVLRDTDGYAERGEPAAELAQQWVGEQQRGRPGDSTPLRVVIFGVAHPDAETWFLVGLKGVEERRQKASKELSFDPLNEPDRLSNEKKGGQPGRDPKRVLRFLLGEGEKLHDPPSAPIPADQLTDLADRCLGDLEALVKSAPGTGLPAFIQRLRAHLAPAILPH